MISLKECPFCGGGAVLMTYAGESLDTEGYMRVQTQYRVLCRMCGIGSKWYADMERTVAAWNRRASDE